MAIYGIAMIAYDLSKATLGYSLTVVLTVEFF